MKLSLCIVTYRSRDLLRDCLKSIGENPPISEYEIIVVDNCSNDGTLEMLAAEFPETHVIENSANRGYTAPMNQAFRMAKGDYVVQLNPDTIIMPDAFRRLLHFMDQHAGVGICAPKVLNRDGSLQKQCRRSEARPWDVFCYFTRLNRIFPKNPLFTGYLYETRGEDETFQVEAVSGSFMLIRSEVIRQIGYLDELFFAYQEDSDYCIRARKAGWQIYYMPEAKIIHYGGEGGSNVDLYRSTIEWHRSYFRYYRKNLAQDYFFLLNGFFYLLMGIKFVLALLLVVLHLRKVAGTPKP